MVRAIKKGVYLDADRYEVFVDGRPRVLANAEFLMLKALLEAKGVVLSRRSLRNAACADATGERSIDTHVCRIRAAIGKDKIVTVPHVGYKLPVSHHAKAR